MPTPSRFPIPSFAGWCRRIPSFAGRCPRIALSFALAAAACGIETDLIGEPPAPPNSQPPAVVNPIQLDRVVQATEPVVDILFVVDNSSSMGDEQQNLNANFPAFIPYFVGSGLDYHIGMTSTEVQRPDHTGKLRTGFGYRFIDDQTVDAEAVFEAMTNSLGVIGGSIESGRAAAYHALELKRDTPFNEGFYRDEAELHIIFVTDADDYSGAQPVTRNEFLQWAASLKSRPSLVTMHSIVGLQNDGFCPSGYRPGISYLQYADVTGGITYSICETDWGPLLTSLGLQTAGLKREFFLTRMPVVAPELLIQVQVREPGVDGGDPVTRSFELCFAGEEVEDPECEAVYNSGRNSVTFLDYLPSPLAEVLLTYHLAEEFSAGVVDEDVF
jgi:hypothetical protein